MTTEPEPDWYHMFNIVSGMRYSDTMNRQQFNCMMARQGRKTTKDQKVVHHDGT